MRQRLSDERGFTLIELLVASMIGTIVLFAAFALIDSTWHGQRTVESRLDAVSRGRMVMEQLTRQLRAQVCLGKDIPPVLEATPTKIVYYASVAPAPTNPSSISTIQKRTLEYQPDGSTGRGKIVETVIDGSGNPPDLNWSVNPPRTRTITRDIVAPGGVLFQYYKYDPDTSPTVFKLNPPISDTDRQIIVQVQATFDAFATDGRDSDRISTRLDSTITVRTADPTDPTRSPKCI